MIEGVNREILKEICEVRMPFGRFEGLILADLPVSYLEWFVRNGGFPNGKLGMQLSTIYEIKINGLMDLLIPIRKTSKPEIGKPKNYKFK